MNTNGLSKHYSVLTAPERLALLTNAVARGDDVEHARLTGTAPREYWRVPHTFGRALAFLTVFSQNRMSHLELAALFFKAAALADTLTGELAPRCRDAIGVYGYLVKLHATV